MPNIALVHSNDEFSELLAKFAERQSSYTVDNFSGIRPPRNRAETLVKRQLHPLADRYDLIQVDELLVNGLIGGVPAFLSKTPLVAYFRGWADHNNAHGELSSWEASRRNIQSKLLLRKVCKTLHISERTRAELAKTFSLPDAAVVHRPIDVNYYAGGSDPFSGDAFRILTMTNLSYRDKLNGVTMILEALKDVFPDHPDLEYLVAGGGQYLSELEEYVSEYPYANQVHLLGFREDVPDVLAGVDLFTYVSFLDAYPTVVLEAQSAGLPVVAGDSMGVPEAVGDAGLVVEPTANGLRKGIESVVEDRDQRQRLAADSRAKMDSFNESVTQQFISHWDHVLD